jgi:leader peptidase (prepilin peptidase)/N-methyltransferase
MPDFIGGVPFWLVKATAIAAGAVFGSFANVLVWRLPRGQSIIRPGSACPACAKPIMWFDNIPVVSWLVLLGRCRACRQPISLRYPLVELCMAVLSLACLYLGLARGGEFTGLPGMLVLWSFPFIFSFLLVVITFIDLEHFRIPHVLTATGFAAGLVSSLAVGGLVGVGWMDSLIGAAAGALPAILIIETYFRLTRREGMGYGDVMLFAMVGATLGYRAMPFVFLASSFQGILVTVPYVLFGGSVRRPPWEEGAGATPPPPAGLRHVPLPFGPVIALAALEWLFFGEWVWGEFVGL